MRIAQLRYTRFGHFTDHVLDLPGGQSDFHIILGANEAGKSTMVEGWLNLLYGIPRQTPYAFRHDRATLEISATVEDNGHAQTLTRLPATRQNLVGPDGAPLPQAVLDRLLCGVSEDAYRQLYCLDDDTIEQGGDDILASKGDLGQLLFAAASGMATFNETLAAMREADRAFHVASGTGRRGSTLARLRKELDAVTAAIRAADLTAPDYRRLRDAAEQAGVRAAETREIHAGLIARDRALEARLNALPILADLVGLDDALTRLGPYPVLPDGTGPEIAELATRREGLLATLRARHADLGNWAAEREGLAIDARADGLAEALTGLRGLRNRAEEADVDLPNRRDERDGAAAGIATHLSRLGLSGLDPSGIAIEAAAVDRLDKATQAHDRAERDLLDATREAEGAAEALARARQTAPGAEDEDPGVLETLLRDLDADAVDRALTEARAAHAEATETARIALADLAIAGVTFAEPGPAPLTAEGAETLDDTLKDLASRLATLTDRLAEQDARVSGLAAEIATLGAQGAAPADADAADLRARRDDLWAAHRAALNDQSAEAFAAAMADDDAATALRLVDTARLADLRRAERDHARAAAEHAATAREQANVRADRGAARAELAAILTRTGLPDGLSAAELADWLRAHDLASAARAEADRTAAALAEAEARAAPVAAALGEALASTAPLSTLLATAQDRLDKSRARQDLLAAAARQLAGAEQDLTRREETARAAEGTLDAALGALSDALAGLGIPLPEHVEPADAVPVLRALIGERQTLAALQDRIAKMEANAADFAARIGALATPWPELSGKPALEQAAMLDRIAAEHRRATERDRDLATDMRRAGERIAAADTELQEIETRAAEIAQAWPEPRPDGVPAIAEAVQKAAEHAALSDRRAGTERLLAQTLGTDVASARAELAGTSETDLTAQRHLLAPELAAAVEARDAAIRALGLAEQALADVSGAGDIARLAQDRQVLLEEIRGATREGLRRRLGLVLAERALARYRDQHRGAMLAETEAAFRDLTGGAYTGLSTQQDGASEVLLAHRARDGRTLRVGEHTMSKGTRFQLYLALRLAGYRQMAAAGTVLPFLCDDIFETFDEDRTAAACRLMHRIGEIGQALYFTHHAHVAEIARANCPGVQVHRL